MKPVEPVRHVLHVMADGNMVDRVFDTVAKRNVAWRKYQKMSPGKPTWRTQTRRTA